MKKKKKKRKCEFRLFSESVSASLGSRRFTVISSILRNQPHMAARNDRWVLAYGLFGQPPHAGDCVRVELGAATGDVLEDDRLSRDCARSSSGGDWNTGSLVLTRTVEFECSCVTVTIR